MSENSYLLCETCTCYVNYVFNTYAYINEFLVLDAFSKFSVQPPPRVDFSPASRLMRMHTGGKGVCGAGCKAYAPPVYGLHVRPPAYALKCVSAPRVGPPMYAPARSSLRKLPPPPPPLPCGCTRRGRGGCTAYAHSVYGLHVCP